MADADLILVGNDKGGTISVLALDTDRLRPLAVAEIGVGCSTFTVAGDLVLVAVKEPDPAIVTLRLDRGDGTLSEVARRGIDGTLAYLSHADGVLFGASYHQGWGAAWQLADGVVGEERSRLSFRNLHSAVPDTTGANVYFASLGDDLIAQFAVATDGTLAPLDPPTVPCPAGSGPRHLVVAPDGRNAYLITEFTAQAIRFERSGDGVLRMRESVPVFDPAAGLGVSAFGRDPRAEHLIWGADVALADGGRWLLCSERSASTIAAVPLEADGRLGEGVVFSPTEAQPRGMCASPDGSRVVVAGERSGGAALYALDEGRLVPLDRVETGLGPNWARFA